MNRLTTITHHIDLILKDKIALLRMLKSYLRKKIFRYSVLRKVNIAVTYDCNANCKHCSSYNLREERRRVLSLEEIKYCIDECIKLGSFVFEFTGGEPLLREDISEAIQFVKLKHAIAGLTTNGLLIDEEKILQFKMSGLDVIQISLDSIFARKHEESRGVVGCFGKLIKSIKLIKKYRIKLMLSTIVTPENISDGSIYKLLEFIKNEKIMLNLNPSCPVGRWKERYDVMLLKNYAEVYNNLINKPFVRWSGHMNFSQEGCSCGVETLYITAYGDVIPCGFIQISYGNIRETAIDKIWKTMCKNSLSCNRKLGCIAALDETFIERYIKPTWHKNKLPVSFEDIS